MTLRARALAALTGGALLAGGLLAAPAQSAVPFPHALAQDVSSGEVRFDATDQSEQTVPDSQGPQCGTPGEVLLVPVVVSGLQGSVKDGTYVDINVRADISILNGTDLSARLVAPGAEGSAPSADLFGWRCGTMQDGSDYYGRGLDGTYTVTDTAASTMQPTPAHNGSFIAPGSYRANSPADAAAPADVTSKFAGLDDLNGTWYVALQDQWGNIQATVSKVSIGFVKAPDTTSPTVTITSGPQNGEPVDAKPTYQFSSSDADVDHYECAASTDYDDLGTFTTCTSPHTVQGIEPGGKYAFGVRAVDTSGNIGPVARGSFLWTGVACDDATTTLTAARADQTEAKTAVKKATAQLKKAKKSGNPVRIKKAKKKLAAAKQDLKDATTAVTAAQAQVDQDC